MLWRLFVFLTFMFISNAVAGDLPAISTDSASSVDDAVAGFVSTRFKMKLVMPFGAAGTLRPGDVILSRQDESNIKIWKLENEKLCQFPEHAAQTKLRDPIKRNPYVLATKFSQPSSLLGLSADQSMSITGLEISSDKDAIYVADTDAKVARTADALAVCKDFNSRALHSYVLNNVREGILTITIHFTDRLSAEAAKERILRKQDSHRLSVDQTGEQLQMRTVAPVVFGVTTRTLTSR